MVSNKIVVVDNDYTVFSYAHRNSPGSNSVCIHDCHIKCFISWKIDVCTKATRIGTKIQSRTLSAPFCHYYEITLIFIPRRTRLWSKKFNVNIIILKANYNNSWQQLYMYQDVTSGIH